MKAKKENKVYQVDESSKEFYLQQGYDIYDDEGKLIENSPLSKISINEHKEIVAEKDAVIEKLEKKIKEQEKVIKAQKTPEPPKVEK